MAHKNAELRVGGTAGSRPGWRTLQCPLLQCPSLGHCTLGAVQVPENPEGSQNPVAALHTPQGAGQLEA